MGQTQTKYKQGNEFKCRACGSFTIDEALPVVTFTQTSYTDYAPDRCSNDGCKNSWPEHPRGWWEAA
ncbi:hypothetical protein QE394_002886 [Arthrobacter sp. SORGH_AS 212]|nr:hypothetical protein [Arthrobacter sp. SORGH_AS_0212]